MILNNLEVLVGFAQWACLTVHRRSEVLKPFKQE